MLGNPHFYFTHYVNIRVCTDTVEPVDVNIRF